MISAYLVELELLRLSFKQRKKSQLGHSPQDMIILLKAKLVEKSNFKLQCNIQIVIQNCNFKEKCTILVSTICNHALLINKGLAIISKKVLSCESFPSYDHFSQNYMEQPKAQKTGSIYSSYSGLNLTAMITLQ